MIQRIVAIALLALLAADAAAQRPHRLPGNVVRSHVDADMASYIVEGGAALPACTEDGTRTSAKHGNIAVLLHDTSTHAAGLYGCESDGSGGSRLVRLSQVLRVAALPDEADSELRTVFVLPDGTLNTLEKRHIPAAAAVPAPTWSELTAAAATTHGFGSTWKGAFDYILDFESAAGIQDGDHGFLRSNIASPFYEIDITGGRITASPVPASDVLPSGWTWIGDFPSEDEADRHVVAGRNLSIWEGGYVVSGEPLRFSNQITTAPTEGSYTFHWHRMATEADLTSYIAGLPATATTAEMQAGTSTAVRSMTPALVKTAIDALANSGLAPLANNHGFTFTSATANTTATDANDGVPWRFSVSTNSTFTITNPQTSVGNWRGLIAHTGSGGTVTVNAGGANIGTLAAGTAAMAIFNTTPDTWVWVPLSSATPGSFAGDQGSAFSGTSASLTPTADNNGLPLRYTGAANSVVSVSNPGSILGHWRVLLAHTGSGGTLTVSAGGNNIGTLASGTSGLAIFNNTSDSWVFFRLSNAGTGGGATNLSLGAATATTRVVASSTGSDVTLPAATGTLAGLLPSADKAKSDRYPDPTGACTVGQVPKCQAGGTMAMAADAVSSVGASLPLEVPGQIEYERNANPTAFDFFSVGNGANDPRNGVAVPPGTVITGISVSLEDSASIAASGQAVIRLYNKDATVAANHIVDGRVTLTPGSGVNQVNAALPLSTCTISSVTSSLCPSAASVSRVQLSSSEESVLVAQMVSDGIAGAPDSITVSIRTARAITGQVGAERFTAGDETKLDAIPSVPANGASATQYNLNVPMSGAASWAVDSGGGGGGGSGRILGVRVYHLNGQTADQCFLPDITASGIDYPEVGNSTTIRMQRIRFNATADETYLAPTFTINWLNSTDASATSLGVDKVTGETSAIPGQHVFNLGAGLYTVRGLLRYTTTATIEVLTINRIEAAAADVSIAMDTPDVDSIQSEVPGITRDAESYYSAESGFLDLSEETHFNVIHGVGFSRDDRVTGCIAITQWAE